MEIDGWSVIGLPYQITGHTQFQTVAVDVVCSLANRMPTALYPLFDRCVGFTGHFLIDDIVIASQPVKPS